jgi:hypothetical protein
MNTAAATDSGEERRFVDELQAGQTVEENAFTSYDTLGQLITKYNGAVKASAPELQVDPDLSDLRDLLAHGRMFSNEPVSPLRVMVQPRSRGHGHGNARRLD